MTQENKKDDVVIPANGIKEIHKGFVSSVDAKICSAVAKNGNPYTFLQISVLSKATGKTLNERVFLDEQKLFFITGK